MEIEVTANPSMEDDSFIIDATREYNNYFVENNCQPLSVYVRSEYGEIIAGLTAKTFWKWLHIDYLYVSKNVRKKNLGTKIMRAAEIEAYKRGCVGSTLDTFSFQALGFYKKLGYDFVGNLTGYDDKFERYYLKKHLTNLTMAAVTT